MIRPNASLETCPFGSELQSYWNRLSDIERQMRLSKEGLYSLALQPIMDEIAEAIPGETVLDPFCGFGGSSIGLARAGMTVTAADLAPDRIDSARYNAELFGINKSIYFEQGNALELLGVVKADAVFLDPPWGGPGYIQKRKFQLADFTPDGFDLLAIALSHFSCVALRVPRNFDFSELSVFGSHIPMVILANTLKGELLHFTVVIRDKGCVRLLNALQEKRAVALRH